MKFKAKDLVVVSGQAQVWMTVLHTLGEGDAEQIVCVWFDTKNRLQRANFPVDALELAPIWVNGVTPMRGQG